MAIQIQLRHDTAANWTSANPTLAAGEVGFETNTGKFKWGDGATAWASLAYSTPGGAPSGSAGGDLAGTYPNPTVKASVGLTGTPTAPTAAGGTNTTQIATTAFVAAAVSTSIDLATAAGLAIALG